MANPSTFIGVDFSGAKLAGRNIWLARAEPTVDRLRLLSLDSLETLCGTADRQPALNYLVDQIATSTDTLWAIDFPFGLPIEIFTPKATWAQQLAWLRQWPADANALGLECVRRARLLGDAMHIRRHTDKDARTPFDCYHYRIIYQTFHGMRDVLLPLARRKGVAILPFQYKRLASATSVVVEGCPSSTLKRLGLPHKNYKQPAGGALELRRRKTRHTILAGLLPLIDLTRSQLRTIMRNPGGDALDAVLAAVGGWYAWRSADHITIPKHARYPKEGFVYF